MIKGRPTNAVRRMVYKIKLAKLHWKYLIPKKFRTPEVFGTLLKRELEKEGK